MAVLNYPPIGDIIYVNRSSLLGTTLIPENDAIIADGSEYVKATRPELYTAIQTLQLSNIENTSEINQFRYVSEIEIDVSVDYVEYIFVVNTLGESVSTVSSNGTTYSTDILEYGDDCRGYAISDEIQITTDDVGAVTTYDTQSEVNVDDDNSTLGRIDHTTFIDANATSRTITELVEDVWYEETDGNVTDIYYSLSLELDGVLTDEEIASCFYSLNITTWDGDTFTLDVSDAVTNTELDKTYWYWSYNGQYDGLDSGKTITGTGSQEFTVEVVIEETEIEETELEETEFEETEFEEIELEVS